MISHAEHIEIIKTLLIKKGNKAVRAASLCDLAKLFLKGILSEHGEEAYRQILRAAIGAKFPSTYAIKYLLLS